MGHEQRMDPVTDVKKAIRVLILEDNAQDAELNLHELSEAGFEVSHEVVETEHDFVTRLGTGLDLILCDYNLPGFDGRRAIEAAQAHVPKVPLIVVTGTLGDERAVECLKLGAADYVLKDNIGQLRVAAAQALDFRRVEAERERQREELLATHTQLRNLLNHSPAVVYALKVKGDLFVPDLASENITRLLGYTVQETMDQDWWWNAVHPEDRDRAVASMLRSLEDESSRSEYRLRRKDGEYRWVQDNCHVVRDEAGNPAELVGVLVDITDRVTAEQTLLESERRFRVMLENMELIAITVDKETRVTFCNDCLLQITGWKREEVIGHDWCERFLKPEDTATRRAFFDNIEAGTVPAHFENTIITRAGEERNIVWNNTILRNTAGDVIGLASIGLDQTEKGRNIERIRKQAQLLDQARDAITVRGLDGRIQFWNHGAEKMLGWTSAEALGHTTAELDPENYSRSDEAFRQTLRHGEWSGELQKVTKDKRRLTVEARWTLVNDEYGRPNSILAINTDITERKRIEAQFLRAQRLESIGTLASGVAHDLNNVLAPIMMAIEMLKDNSRDPMSLSILETLESSAHRGADIVRQVLSFGRGAEGERSEVQLRHLVSDIERIVRDTFPKDIRLRVAIDSEPWVVIGDPTHLYQMLLNLCVNARDAMPQGGLLTIHLENRMIDDQFAAMNIEAKVGPYVLIEVADTGTGMPRAILEKIFDPFFTTKEPGKGTGLGLSTVQALVKSHGGFMEVNSEPGKGTKFSLFIPARPSSSSQEELATATHLPRGSGETVLLVDEEFSILAITGQTLEIFGYNVIPANDGAEALALYLQHRDEIAVVLTDMMMPVMDGAAAIHALKKINPAVKVIAASGLSTDGNIARATELGVKHFIPKPYNARTLLEKLQAILRD